MKRFKFIVFAVCVALIATFAMACGDNAEGGKNGKTYTFEAEGIDLSGLNGRGYSNEASETGMILGENTKSIRNEPKVLNSLSNKYFVGFFTTPGTTFTFNIKSDAAATDNTLILRLGSEWGTLKLNKSILKVTVNDVELDYETISVTGHAITDAKIFYAVPFDDYQLSTKIALNSGDNTVKLTILSNSMGVPNFPSVGPGVDCIKIKSKAALTWESMWESNFEEVEIEE